MNSSVRSSVALGAALRGVGGHRRTRRGAPHLLQPQEEWCQIMVTAFEKETGTTVAMTRKSSGETYARSAPRRTTRRATSGGAGPATRTCRQPRRG